MGNPCGEELSKLKLTGSRRVLSSPQAILMTEPALPFATASILTLSLFTIASYAQTSDSQLQAKPKPQVETIEIKLVDGRTGHPLAGSCVSVWVGKQRKEAMAIPTDENGIAWLQLTDMDGRADIHQEWKGCGLFGVINPVVRFDDPLGINVGYALCQPDAGDYSWLKTTELATGRVLHDGIAMANNCGKPRAAAKPGEVIIFVRPLSWWEKWKQ